jgi:hypothetical protein
LQATVNGFPHGNPQISLIQADVFFICGNLRNLRTKPGGVSGYSIFIKTVAANL